MKPYQMCITICKYWCISEQLSQIIHDFVNIIFSACVFINIWLLDKYIQYMLMFLDYRTPFVRMAQDYDVVFIREGEQVVIPCLVSVENLDVTLYTVSVYTHTYSPALHW